MTFSSFDPLEFKNTVVSAAALGALKREIENILSSYVGWYDPFCELIQNSLDAVEARAAIEDASGTGEGYQPYVYVRVDLDENTLTVTDNGIGLDKDKFEQFLAPNFSFKSGGKTRGHKGVGATYVAYGFNYMRISTRVPGFEASGRIVGARTWLHNSSSASNPKVEPDDSQLPDGVFSALDRGVSITVRFDADTHPKRLDWIQATTAETWAKILSIKTGIGAATPSKAIKSQIVVINSGKETRTTLNETGYFWLHTGAAKKLRVRDVLKAEKDLFEKYGGDRKMPDKYMNLDFLYDSWTTQELSVLLAGRLDEEDLAILEKHRPTLSVEFGYTAKIWTQFNDALNLRHGYRVLNAGVQLAANNMPQGEAIQIPLAKNIGRQNQVHFLLHFDNYTPDLGRKGFHRELTDFAKKVSRLVTDHTLSRLRKYLKANTGASPDLVREMEIDEWKNSMAAHENAQPLLLKSQHFFLPTERISITSTPTREQDVIALFHQLIAGGVIRGLSIMSTNERFTYDGLFRIGFDLAPPLYVYDSEKNPLGVPEVTANALAGKVTSPKVLEYKLCLDGLIEDFDSQDKFIKDLDLCVVWTTGELYRERYGIVSLLVPENADQRQYHGVTHVLTDIETNSTCCHLIVLSELIAYLNDQESTAVDQRAKYE